MSKILLGFLQVISALSCVASFVAVIYILTYAPASKKKESSSVKSPFKYEKPYLALAIVVVLLAVVSVVSLGTIEDLQKEIDARPQAETNPDDPYGFASLTEESEYTDGYAKGYDAGYADGAAHAYDDGLIYSESDLENACEDAAREGFDLGCKAIWWVLGDYGCTVRETEMFHRYGTPCAEEIIRSGDFDWDCFYPPEDLISFYYIPCPDCYPELEALPRE